MLQKQWTYTKSRGSRRVYVYVTMRHTFGDHITEINWKLKFLTGSTG